MKFLVLASGLAALGICLLTFSCSKSEEKYSYEFSCNECETGKHEFDEKDKYCKALEDEDLNKGCCKDTRSERKKSDC